jgi:hypothetical protein
VLALLADGDVLFILSLAFWAVNVTHRIGFVPFGRFVKKIIRKEIFRLLFNFTIYTTIYR